jgi:transposase
MKTSRRTHSAEFKAKVALAALREQETIPEIARRYGVHANVIYKWKRQLSENVSRAFDGEGPSVGASERDLLIPSTARARGLTVVTHNVSEFRRVPHLVVEDWL